MSSGMTPQSTDLLPELSFTTSRSSGPGGQNVNKVNTKVNLKWDVVNSQLLTAEQKVLLLQKLGSRLTKDGMLLLSAQEKRSQLQNKEAVLSKLDALLIKIFTIRKARKATKPGKAVKRKRMEDKRHHAEKKQRRQKLL